MVVGSAVGLQANVCEVAFSPLDLRNDLLERASELVKYAGKPSLTRWTVESDILRCAWMFTGAAVDTYFHERIRRALLRKPMSESARQYEIQLGPVEDMVDAFLSNRSGARPTREARQPPSRGPSYGHIPGQQGQSKER